jgi:hypothetical protein
LHLLLDSVRGPVVIGLTDLSRNAGIFIKQNNAWCVWQDVDMEEDMDMEVEAAGRGPPPGMPPLPAEEEEEEEEAPIKVVKNYDRRAARGGPASYDPTKYAVSPITGELVPLAEMAEHMRVSLLGKRKVWGTQRGNTGLSNKNCKGHQQPWNTYSREIHLIQGPSHIFPVASSTRVHV